MGGAGSNSLHNGHPRAARKDQRAWGPLVYLWETAPVQRAVRDCTQARVMTSGPRQGDPARQPRRGLRRRARQGNPAEAELGMGSEHESELDGTGSVALA